MNQFFDDIFPSSYHDEPLDSIVDRYRVITGRTTAASIRRLFGTETKIPAATLPRNLDRFQFQTAACLGSVGEVVDRHTTFPYYRPFLPPAIAGRLLEQMRGPAIAGQRRFVGVAGVPRFRSRRMCPICVTEHMRTLPTSYWLRSHQLPGVTVCAEHESDLIDACPRCGPFELNRITFPLPQLRCPKCLKALSPTYRKRDGNRRGGGAVRFARVSRDLLQSNINFVPVDLRNRAYRARLRSAGAPQREALEWLRDRCTAEYSSALLDRLGALKGDQVNLPRWLLDDGKGPFHPAFQVILIDLLFGSTAEWDNALRGELSPEASRGDDRLRRLFQTLNYDLIAVAKAADRPPWSIVEEMLSRQINIADDFSIRDARREMLIDSALLADIEVPKIGALLRAEVSGIYKRRREHVVLSSRTNRTFKEVRATRRALFESMRRSARSLVGATEGGFTYEAIHNWLAIHDKKWLAKAKQRIDRVEVNQRRNRRDLLPQRRALFVSMRASPHLLKGSVSRSGLSYDALFSWLRDHDGDWLTSTLAKRRPPSGPSRPSKRPTTRK